MAKIFARDSYGCLVVSDCSKPDTLEDTLDWKKVMNEESVFVDGKKIPFILVQNKIDLIGDKMELEDIENQTKKLADDNEFIKYFMTSVKEDININETMNFLIANIIDRMEVYAASGGEVFADQKRKDTIRLRDTTFHTKDEKRNCC